MSRYPMRKRAATSYKETSDWEDLLGGDDVDVSDGDQSDEWHNENKTTRKKKSSARKPHKPRTTKKFRFMNLPPELRVQIYKLVVASPDGIVTIQSQHLIGLRLRRQIGERGGHIGRSETVGYECLRNFRLLRANKLIYHEAAEVFYGQTFSFKSASALQGFLLLQRPETMSRLRHVQLQVGDTEWTFMPGVAAQMSQLSGLKKLTINGLGQRVNRDVGRYLTSTNRPPHRWEINAASWDKLTGIKFAWDLYPSLFPLFHKVIHERGPEGLARMLHFDDDPWVRAPYTHSWCELYRMFRKIRDEANPPTDERRELQATAMCQEIVKLMEQDFS